MNSSTKAARWTVGLLAAACLLVLHAAPVRAEAEGTVLREEWHALYVNGRKCGHQHYVTRPVRKDGRLLFRTSIEQAFSIRRGGMTLQFDVDKTVTEDESGLVVSFRLDSRQGPLRQVTEGHVEGQELVLKSGVGGEAAVTRIPAPRGLCPWAVDRLRRRQGFEPGTSYSFNAFVPEFPSRALETSVTVGPTVPVHTYKGVQQLHKLDYRVSLLSGLEATDWVDEENTTWRSRATAGPGLQMEFRLVPREQALLPGRPADILVASFVKTDREIPRPRELERLRLLLLPKGEGSKLAELPAGPHQRVERTAEGLVVTIRRARPSPEKSYRLPYRGKAHRNLLAPNRWMQTEDASVSAAAREALAGTEDALTAARRIEDYVSAKITRKDLSRGMGTALDALRDGSGDCTEHAVLVAALARASGMPARVVAGLAYVKDWPGVGDTFGYHMWTEVWVGQWLPLDGALGGHDATHLAMTRSDMNSPDALPGVVGIIAFLGKIKVRVLEVGR